MKPALSFEYHSQRSYLARVARHLTAPETYWVLALLGVVVFAAGVTVVWQLELSLGWLLAGCSGPFWMLAGLARALNDMPPRPQMRTIDDVLDMDVLGQLPAEHSPLELATIAMHLPGGRFFTARFGLVLPFLSFFVSKRPADSARVWQEAERLRAASGLPNISAAALTAALVRTMPEAEQQLAQLRLGLEDLTFGLEWYNCLEAMIAEHTERPHDGGLARDWAFGYTPLLERFGRNFSLHAAVDAPSINKLPSREAAVQHIVHFLAQAGKRNAALVGGLGSGKTAVVQALAKRLATAHASVPHALHFWQIIALDPSTLIARAKGRGELEDLVQRLCFEALTAKNTILFFDDAQLFFEDASGAVDLSNVLLPILEDGGLPLILAMNEQRWLKISQANPALAQQFNRVPLAPMDEPETMRVMQEQFVLYEHQQKVLYTFQALDAAYQLSSRFMSEQVMPGRALKVLEAAAAHAEEGGTVTRRSVEQAIEQVQGVKVGTADSAAERETLLNLEELIHRRMINQTRAVQVVSDALRRARAGVRNQSRPIGTFLFLGPTGVGKTELAKSVAAVFFGGEEHLVRLDLNQFVQPGDVARLIADPAEDAHSLTAQIGRNPFSVVLLDEIEKAHPNVLNTLLQMLDEGILRDVNNREISFRDAVVIATSNAGAEQIRQHIEAGEQLEQFEEAFVDQLINDNVFRPELLNRFDEIVLFRPLKPEELRQVVDIILAGINKNLAAQKVSVVVDDDAKQLLVEHGYDPRLGARPLRRVIQRAVENIVSRQLLSGQATPGSQVRIGLEEVKAMLERGNHETST